MTIKRTSAGLSELMYTNLEKLEAGDITPQHLRAVASGVSMIIATKRLEMDNARFISSNRIQAAKNKLLEVDMA